MARKLDLTFAIPTEAKRDTFVLALLGGCVSYPPESLEHARERLKRLQEEAKGGLASSQSALAHLLLLSAPSQKTNRDARRWLEKSIVHDDPLGYYLLGILYARGQGVIQNKEKAIEYLEQAALLGNARAQIDLAHAYAIGFSVPIDHSKRLYWLRLAAAQGELDAQRESGELYQTGLGGNKDLTQSAKWLNKSACKGDAQSQFQLSNLYENKSFDDYEPSKAFFWLKEAALSGHLVAQYRLGLSFWSGRYGQVNIDEAVKWTCRSAEKNNPDALFFLSSFFLAGSLFPIDPVKAYVVAHQAVRFGHPYAEQTMNDAYARLNPEQIQKAQFWLETYPTTGALIKAIFEK